MERKRVLLFAGLAALTLTFPRSTLAEYRTEKNLKLGPGGRFTIDSSAGSVTIAGTSESGARIVVTSNRDDLEDVFDLQFEESAGEVRVTAHKKGAFRWPNHLWVHFDVRVPAETEVDVRTGGGSVEISQLKRDADLKTSGGSIKVSDLAANLKAHTSGGSIELRRVTGDARIDTSGGGIEGNRLGGSIEARTSGGSVEFDEVKGDLLAHTSGGSIRIENAGGKVDAQTSGGSVEVAFAKGNARGGEVGTSGGGVRVALDPTVNLNLDASTSSGTVTMDHVPMTVTGTISTSHLSGKIGSGGETLRVHSDGGPVRIEAR
jgi:DUF4097 and DUF4098 domain-containing protein YvlB